MRRDMALKWDADRIVGISAMVIGIGSLLTIAYQASLMRQAQHASVLPYLYISLGANEQQGVRLLLSNSGIGPAIIDDVHVRYQGRDFTSDPYDFVLAQRPDIAKLGLGVDKVQTGRLIPAGVTIQMVDFGIGQKLLPDVLRLFEIAEVPRAWYTSAGAEPGQKAVIEITYKSVYGDRWRVRSDRIVPEGL
jgi:hypothetical protein